MPDDPTLQWKQVSRFGILIDEDADAWYSGHLTDIIDFPDRAMRVIATDTGGVWMVNDDLEALSLSENWDIPDVRALARGPDGPDHLFAGCGLRFFPDLAPIIMETDPGGTFPLLEWYPVSNALPANAGKIMRIAVIRNLRRIVAACAKWTDSDTGGGFLGDDPELLTAIWPPETPLHMASGQGGRFR